MTLYGVSVGTGDPADITVKALDMIAKCRIIAVPVSRDGRSAALAVARQACDLSGKEILPLDMPMTRDKNILSAAHNAAADKLCSILEAEDAAMLCLGDISLYSTFAYIAEIVRARGFEVRCAAGVCSPCAAAAALGEPLALGNEPLLILPFSAENFTELVTLPCRKAVMKSGANGGAVRRILDENGLLENARAVENCGTADEKIFLGRDIPDETGYFTIYIV